MAGFDTAGYVNQVWASVGTHYGRPLFWLRYFSPCQTTPVNVSSSNAIVECRGVWDSNSSSPNLGPITVPAQSRLNGTSAEGHADAQTLASTLVTVYRWVGPLQLPSNQQLYCWLDQEYNTSLSLAYWNGWSGYIDGFNFAGTGIYALYPCLYCSPQAPPPNCSTIGNGSANHCFAVWTPEPQRCGYSLTNTPSWAAATCAGYSSTPTRVWQFEEQGACNLAYNVDMDVGAPGFNTGSYCFHLSSRP